MIRLPALGVTALLAIAAVSAAAAQKAPPGQQAPAPPAGKNLGRPGARTQPGGGAGGGGGAPVTPQAARATTASAGASTFTAGLAMAPYAGGSGETALEYGARFGRMLDSAIVSLVGVFRNTSGQPMAGANGPNVLSQRERDRWSRCRNLFWDLTTYATSAHALRPYLPADQGVQQAAAGLDSALAAVSATANSPVAECDNVASMVAAPDRWTPWQDQYEAAARHFYRDFYPLVRGAHERDRAFVNAVNALLPPARRLAVPAGLPANPPYAGAGPGE